jgi:D-xylose reductase
MSAPNIKLNSGHDMPIVGFGMWKVDNATCADQIYNAIKAGYRLFDGACGKNARGSGCLFVHVNRAY